MSDDREMEEGNSVILEEEIDENWEPDEQEIRDYAEFLGMDLEEDQDLLWIAREGLKAPLPKGWKPCKTAKGEIYYFNFETGEPSMWDHPCDAKYKELYKIEKAKKIASKQNATKSMKLSMPTNPNSLAASNVSSNTSSYNNINQINGNQNELNVSNIQSPGKSNKPYSDQPLISSSAMASPCGVNATKLPFAGISTLTHSTVNNNEINNTLSSGTINNYSNTTKTPSNNINLANSISSQLNGTMSPSLMGLDSQNSSVIRNPNNGNNINSAQDKRSASPNSVMALAYESSLLNTDLSTSSVNKVQNSTVNANNINQGKIMNNGSVINKGLQSNNNFNGSKQIAATNTDSILLDNESAGSTAILLQQRAALSSASANAIFDNAVKLEEMEKKHRDEINRLSQLHREEISKLVTEQKDEISKLTSSHSATIKKMQTDFSDELRKMRQENNDERVRLRISYDEEYDRMRQQHESEMKRRADMYANERTAQDKRDIELHKLLQSKNEVIVEFEKRLKDADSLQEKLNSQVSATLSNCEKLKEQLQEMEEKKKEYNENIASKEKELEELKTEIEKITETITNNKNNKSSISNNNESELMACSNTSTTMDISMTPIGLNSIEKKQQNIINENNVPSPIHENINPTVITRSQALITMIDLDIFTPLGHTVAASLPDVISLPLIQERRVLVRLMQLIQNEKTLLEIKVTSVESKRKAYTADAKALQAEISNYIISRPNGNEEENTSSPVSPTASLPSELRKKQKRLIKDKERIDAEGKTVNESIRKFRVCNEWLIHQCKSLNAFINFIIKGTANGAEVINKVLKISSSNSTKMRYLFEYEFDILEDLEFMKAYCLESLYPVDYLSTMTLSGKTNQQNSICSNLDQTNLLSETMVTKIRSLKDMDIICRKLKSLYQGYRGNLTAMDIAMRFYANGVGNCPRNYNQSIFAAMFANEQSPSTPTANNVMNNHNVCYVPSLDITTTTPLIPSFSNNTNIQQNAQYYLNGNEQQVGKNDIFSPITPFETYNNGSNSLGPLAANISTPTTTYNNSNTKNIGRNSNSGKNGKGNFMNKQDIIQTVSGSILQEEISLKDFAVKLFTKTEVSLILAMFNSRTWLYKLIISFDTSDSVTLFKNNMAFVDKDREDIRNVVSSSTLLNLTNTNVTEALENIVESGSPLSIIPASASNANLFVSETVYDSLSNKLPNMYGIRRDIPIPQLVGEFLNKALMTITLDQLNQQDGNSINNNNLHQQYSRLTLGNCIISDKMKKMSTNSNYDAAANVMLSSSMQRSPIITSFESQIFDYKIYQAKLKESQKFMLTNSPKKEKDIDKEIDKNIPVKALSYKEKNTTSKKLSSKDISDDECSTPPVTVPQEFSKDNEYKESGSEPELKVYSTQPMGNDYYSHNRVDTIVEPLDEEQIRLMAQFKQFQQYRKLASAAGSFSMIPICNGYVGMSNQQQHSSEILNSHQRWLDDFKKSFEGSKI